MFIIILDFGKLKIKINWFFFKLNWTFILLICIFTFTYNSSKKKMENRLKNKFQLFVQ